VGIWGFRLRPEQMPFALVGIAVLFGLITLAAEVRDAWYLNDASVHESMVGWAADRIRAGHLPFDGWYPNLALGASRFHHYQSLPHIFTGLLSVVLGPATFRWSLYLLLASWPISVFAGGRLMGLGRWPAAAAALVSPILVSAPGLGYEWGSYLWRGLGAWAQLWGMWALPLAWGFSWRAVTTGGRLWLGALAVAVALCLHLLTGYLALLSLGVWVLVRPRAFPRRLVRAALVGLGALAVAAWMLVPLIADAPWTINDEFSRGSIYYDSFGAAQIIRWGVSGALFDDERFPVVSILVLVGTVVALKEARRREAPRAVLGAGLLSLLLFFGRPTLGPLLDLMPGAEDLFFRRFVSGVHLAGLYLAGLGLVWIAGHARSRLRRVSAHGVRRGAVAITTVLTALLLAPGFIERAVFAARGTPWMEEQQAAERTEGAAFAALVARAEREGPGRIFGGHRSGGDAGDRIGFVPTYAVPLNLGSDSVGFTRPTWSLMSAAEYRFDPDDAGMRRLFGVRYVIRDRASPPPDGGVDIAEAGRFVLHRFDDISYVSVVDTIAPIAADRLNLGEQTSWLLRSDLVEKGMLPTIAFGGRPAASPTLGPNVLPRASPGRVLDVLAGPQDGVFIADVELQRRAVILLSSSFDPRWTVQVDGVRSRPQMVAPALVGVTAGPGRHRVVFAYAPFSWHGPLLLAAVLAIVGLALGERVATRARKR
jgi:hypothetical protein